MHAVVMIVDQRSRRASTDLVTEAARTLGAGALLPFSRLADDEICAVFTDPDAAVATIAELVRSDEWSLGVGIGAIDDRLPSSAAEVRGSAQVRAREAALRARQAHAHLAVVGPADDRAEQLETVIRLWAGVLHRRTRRGWEVADLVAAGLSHQEIADRLGITPSAVTQRGQAAGLTDAARAETLVTQMLAALLEHPG